MSSADLASERAPATEREASAEGDLAPEHDGPRDTGMDDASLHGWLAGTWGTAPGIVGALSSVDHKVIARRYLITAFVFLCLGGLNAVAMRIQLSGPQRGLIGPDLYLSLIHI